MTDQGELAKVKQALERAAIQATGGAASAKSGRLGTIPEISRQLLVEAQGAYAKWANWEAINNQLAAKSIVDAVSYFELGSIGDVRSALLRDAFLTAFRLSDPVGADNLTLCFIVERTQDPSSRARYQSLEWAIDLGYASYMASSAAAENADRLARLHSLVAANWKKEVPQDREFLRLRTVLRPVRDTLAHCLPQDEAPVQPILDDIRRFLSLTLSVCTDVAMVFLGNAIDPKRFEEFSADRAETFWRLAFKAPLDAHEAHLAVLREAGLAAD